MSILSRDAGVRLQVACEDELARTRHVIVGPANRDSPLFISEMCGGLLSRSHPVEFFD